MLCCHFHSKVGLDQFRSNLVRDLLYCVYVELGSTCAQSLESTRDVQEFAESNLSVLISVFFL